MKKSKISKYIDQKAPKFIDSLNIDFFIRRMNSAHRWTEGDHIKPRKFFEKKVRIRAPHE